MISRDELSLLYEWVSNEALVQARQKIQDGHSPDYYQGLYQGVEYIVDLFNTYNLNHGDFTACVAALALAAAERVEIPPD
ncbi:MAG: hypothetical protein ACPGVO_08975 [Spirulinaceae cyanobacterium]